MGIFDLEPGTVKWQGNRFHAFYQEHNLKIEGELFPSPGGFPSHMQITYTSLTNQFVYLTRYTYQKETGLRYIPSQLQSFELVNGRQRERGEITILQITPSSDTLSPSVFDAGPYIAANHAGIRFYTNGALYEVNPHGDLVLAKTTREPIIQQKNPFSFYGVAAATTAAFFVLAVRAKHSEQIQKRKHE
jgi:hypothetical protein